MRNDNVMDRLRAARPAPPPPADDHDARFAKTIAEPGDPRLADPTTIGKARPARRWITRPRILAGGSLGLAGLAAGLVLAFSGSTAPPAFAITQNSDGSLLVHLYHVSDGEAARLQIHTMGISRFFFFYILIERSSGTLDRIRGPATVPGPITCQTGDPGQHVEMLLGSDGTDVVPAGRRGAGPWHLIECTIYADNGASNTGTTTGSTGASTVTTGDTSTNSAG